MTNTLNSLISSSVNIVAAHSTFRIAEELRRRCPRFPAVNVRSAEALRPHLRETEVLVISGLWDNRFLSMAPRLRYVQSVSAGIENYDLQAFAEHKVMLANAAGINTQAVAEHAMMFILALSRHILRDLAFQKAGQWRPLEPEQSTRSGEIAGKSLLLVGYGNVGQTIARMARAFGMSVVAATRNPARHNRDIEIVSFTDLPRHYPTADYVVLCCPLTDDTRGIIDRAALRAMPRTARIVNVGRGECLDLDAVEKALRSNELSGAAIDVFPQEPLPETSALRDAPNLIMTSHVAGETPRYEERLVDILLTNIGKLQVGETDLENRII